MTDAAGEVRFSAPDDVVIEASHPEAGRGRARIDMGVQVSLRVRIQLVTEVPRPLRGDRSVRGSVVDVRIRGPEGTTVRLRVRRAGSEESQVIDVPRRRIRA